MYRILYTFKSVSKLGFNVFHTTMFYNVVIAYVLLCYTLSIYKIVRNFYPDIPFCGLEGKES